MAAQNDFLGKGWAFPPEFVKGNVNGDVLMVAGREDIDQSLGILLRTSLGERVMLPDFGCNLADYQFDPMNSALMGFVKDLIYNALLFYEPRIKVENLSVNTPDSWDAIEGRLLISVDYIIVGSNSRFNFVFDYYVNEAASRSA